MQPAEGTASPGLCGETAVRRTPLPFEEVNPTDCFTCLNLLRGFGELAESWGRICGKYAENKANSRENRTLFGERNQGFQEGVAESRRGTGQGGPREARGQKREQTDTASSNGEKSADDAKLKD